MTVEPRPIGEVKRLPQYIHHSHNPEVRPWTFTSEFAAQVTQCLGDGFEAYYYTGDDRWYALSDDGFKIDIHAAWIRMWELFSGGSDRVLGSCRK